MKTLAEISNASKVSELKEEINQLRQAVKDKEKELEDTLTPTLTDFDLIPEIYQVILHVYKSVKIFKIKRYKPVDYLIYIVGKLYCPMALIKESPLDGKVVRGLSKVITNKSDNTLRAFIKRTFNWTELYPEFIEICEELFILIQKKVKL